MKNMKKILALGALLTLGTMTMGTPAGIGVSSADDFPIMLNVISPIEINNTGGNIDFGQLTTDQIKTGGSTETGSFQVTADDRNNFSFKVVSDFNLKNTQDESIIGFEIELKDLTDGSVITPDTNHETTEGLLEGAIQVTLAASNSQVISLGEYTGNVNIEVAYN